MSNLKKQTECIQLSIYSNIICQTLQNHEKLSICKLVTFSYLIKKNRFLGGTIYTAGNTQDVIYKGISLLSGDFDGFCNSVPYILKALHILLGKEIVTLDNGILSVISEQLKLDSIYKESTFIRNVIEESKHMTDRQFMKEVMYNV